MTKSSEVSGASAAAVAAAAGSHVSDTHLDVYKRQGQGRGDQTGQPQARADVRRREPDEDADQARHRPGRPGIRGAETDERERDEQPAADEIDDVMAARAQ